MGYRRQHIFGAARDQPSNYYHFLLQQLQPVLRDNGKPHVTQLTQKNITEFGWEILEYPPYLPGLAPSDYYFFLSFQNHFGNKKSNDFNEIHFDLAAFFSNRDLLISTNVESNSCQRDRRRLSKTSSIMLLINLTYFVSKFLLEKKNFSEFVSTQ